MKTFLRRTLSSIGIAALAIGTSSAFANDQTPKQDIDFECIMGVVAECAGMKTDLNPANQDFEAILNCVMEGIAEQCS